MAQVETRQKVLVLDENFEFSVQDRPIPKVQDGELLIKVIATALNPGDWKIQRWGVKFGGQPVIPGMDTAGVVEEVGQNVVGFQKGDRIMTMGTWTTETSSFQQYMRTMARFAAKIPDNISDEVAASVPVGLLAAWIGLYNDQHGAGYPHPLVDESKFKPISKPLLVLGGSSSVGQYVLQLAKLSKFSPVITTASLHHTDYLRSLGATHVLDRRLSDEQVVSEIRKITDAPFETVFDAISSTETKLLGYGLLAREGKILTCDTRFGEFTLPAPDFPEIESDPANPKYVVPVKGVTVLPETVGMAEVLFKDLTRLLKDGVILPNKVEVLSGGLHGIPEGLVRIENGLVSGVKLVVRPQDTT
ncbi:GroES-like protein [Dendrothele bispora CBS 962.96]|uniref:GroES-like protein n=1 Tax=Dendrothele bispora (strain CBS 962.96) TaxID=1314807 RepID=A0A4V4HHG4_DENBC|nr:GroES-like protein [Dendrothele bispora CBS 962.96]